MKFNFGRTRECGVIALGLVCLLSAAGISAQAASPIAIRLGSGEKDLERYREYGYNAVLLGDLTQLAGYEALCPGAIAQDSPLRQKIEQHRKRFLRESQRARALGLEVCLSTDEVQLPTVVLERFRKSILRAGLSERVDFGSAAFWELYRAKYREVLRAYPAIALVMVRTGENYSHVDPAYRGPAGSAREVEDYTGHTVLDQKMDEAYFRNMCRLIEETRKVVVDEFGRKLIWRTWDLGNDGFHANPKVYDRILAGLPERNGLILSLKFTQTDFWRYNDFNPNIGRGNIPQIVEFQCAREDEGKGAFPDFMGPEHAEALRRARDLGVKSVWIWNFGGGWGGPYIKSERWVRANIEATARLAQDPDLSPRLLAGQWAAKEFGPSAAPKVAELLLLSSECVRKCFYDAPYACAHKGWLPSRNLLRDDIIRGEQVKNGNGGTRQLYEGSKPSLAEALQEKEEAVALARRMRELFESTRPSVIADRGERVYRESLSSLLYLEALTKVVSHYVRGMFLFYQWQETRDAATAARAETELRDWQRAWQDYQTHVPKLPGAASLYRSQNTQEPDSTPGAMADTCEAALRALTSRAGAKETSSLKGELRIEN
jgi:hypothetical protein